jgi:hypothetical protein
MSAKMVTHPHPGQNPLKMLSKAKCALLDYHVQSAQSNKHRSAADAQISISRFGSAIMR